MTSAFFHYPLNPVLCFEALTKSILPHHLNYRGGELNKSQSCCISTLPGEA